MKIIYIATITALLSLSCTQNNKILENRTDIKDMNKSFEQNRRDSIIKEFLIKINDPEDWGSDYYFITKDELELEFTLIYEYLQKRGFKFPQDSILDKVRKELLAPNNDNKGFVVNHNGYKTILSPHSPIKIKNEIYIDNDYEFKDLFDVEVYVDFNLFLNYKYKFVTDLIPLPYIIDPDSDTIDIKIPPYIEYFNNYLIYGSQSSLTWLKLNNPDILDRLFSIYGYTKDKKLNQWILDKRLENQRSDEFGKAFYYKRFDKTVRFNPEVFEVFEEKVDTKYVSKLLSLSSRMGFNDDPFAQNLTFEQKSELFARLMYLGEDVVNKNSDVKINDDYYKTLGDYTGLFMGRFISSYTLYPEECSKYYEEFKRNHFYNLPHFEKYWQSGQRYFEMITPPPKYDTEA